MRPYVANERGALVPDMAASLYVMRDTRNPRFWRLAWSRDGDSSYCMAEGECSAIYHRTMGAAVAYGRRVYGETAKRAPWGV